MEEARSVQDLKYIVTYPKAWQQEESKMAKVIKFASKLDGPYRLQADDLDIFGTGDVVLWCRGDAR